VDAAYATEGEFDTDKGIGLSLFRRGTFMPLFLLMNIISFLYFSFAADRFPSWVTRV